MQAQVEGWTKISRGESKWGESNVKKQDLLHTNELFVRKINKNVQLVYIDVREFNYFKADFINPLFSVNLYIKKTWLFKDGS